MKEHIQYDYLFDNHFNELKELEMATQRISIVTQMDPFVGKYFSVEHVRKHILGQTDKDMREMDKQMRKEIDAGLVMNPVELNSFDTMDRQNAAFAPEIQGIQADDSAERESEAADAGVDREIKKAKAMPKASPTNK